ncbi:ATP-binding protein [Thioclava sp.]|uniref:ATP-binding response regulator n=1 Tax=Thioclava sp. TaxID=1933450 RepID=UPI003AA8A9A0
MKTPRHSRTTDQILDEQHARHDRVSMLAHDARSALADILGGLSLFPDASLDPQTHQQLERIQSASEYLARLLELGLDISIPHYRAGADYPLRLFDFLTALERRWRGAAEAAGMEFHLAVAPDVPAILGIDALALERILANVISNAIAYAGSVPIHILFEMRSATGLRVYMRDAGPGFAPDNLATLFDRGQRGAQAHLRQGDGLGLFIARTLTHQLGGDITARNRSGGGAEIRLDVPLSTARPTRRLAHRHDDITLPDLTNCRVLVADDSLTNQAVLEKMLSAFGARIETQSDGIGALTALLEAPFDLAVLDIDMPGESGLGVIAALRDSGRDWADLPIIACTGFVLRPDHEAIMAAGADAILTKPINGMLPLACAINKALAAKPAFCKARRGAQDLLFSALQQRAEEPESKTLALYIIADLKMIARAMMHSWQQVDTADIQRQCHKLIAVAGAVGETALSTQARALHCAIEQETQDDIHERVREAPDRTDSLIHQITSQFSIKEYILP